MPPFRPLPPPYHRLIGPLLAVALGTGACVLLALLLRPRPSPSRTVSAPAPAPARATAPPPLPPGMLRIGLLRLSGSPALTLRPSGPVTVSDGADGKVLKKLKGPGPLRVVADPSGQVLLKGPGVWLLRPELALSARLTQIGGGYYPGKLRFRQDAGGLRLVNELDIEQYLQGVLPGELPRGFALEAQKAQAVAARSYALAERGKHGDFDLCDGTDCQVYVGIAPRSARGLAAVKATRGLCLWSGSQVAFAFYSADCGGMSTTAENVPIPDKPPGPLPYLRVVRDAPPHGPDYCASSPFHHWTRRLTRAEMETRLNGRPETEIGVLDDVKVTEYDASGRVKTVLLTGHEALPADSAGSAPANVPAGAAAAPIRLGAPTQKSVTGWTLRRALGGGLLRSTRLAIDQPEPDVFRFTGSGNGHGLGLCQIGANGMAKQGAGFRRILAHYYPGAVVASLASKAGTQGRGSHG
jgi:stage II sporulation protein D